MFSCALFVALFSFGQRQMDFNGSNSYISFNDHAINGMSEFTVELWVKPENIGSGYKSLVGEDNCFEFGFKSQQIHVWLEGENSSGSHTYQSVYAGSGLSSLNGTWHHIAVVFSSSNIIIYLDGNQLRVVSNNLRKVQPNGTAKNLSIGGYVFSSSGHWFEGSMDEIRIWKKALTGNDIRTMMCQNITTSGSTIRGVETNETSPSNLNWTNDIECLYNMDYNVNALYDDHYPWMDGTLHNMTRSTETSPMPYKTIASGNWENSTTWKSGQTKPQNRWAITDINHNVSVTDFASSRWLEVTSGDVLTVGSNKSLTIEDVIDNDGTIELGSHASIIQNHEGSDNNTGTGKYIVNREGGGADTKYNIWASPISNANIVSTFSGVNPCDVYGFDGGLQKWKYDYSSGFSTSCKGNPVTFSSNDVFSGGDGIMDKGRGYFIPGKAGDAMRTFEGNINNGNITFPVFAANNPGGVDWTGDNWNLVGNPYPSALDLRLSSSSSFMNVNSARITGDIYFWIDDSSGGSGYNQSQDYAVYNGTGGTAANGSEPPGGFASSGQGFWVIATSNGNVTFNNDMRSSTDNNIFYKAENNPDDLKVWLNLTNDKNQFNQILVGAVGNTTLGYDMGYDAPKAEGNDKINFSSVINDEYYSIQAVPQLQQHDSVGVELYMNLGYEGIHFISIDKTLNLGNNDKVYLLDKENNKVHDLSKGPFSFYIDQPKEIKERFYLQLNKGEEEDTSTFIAENALNDKLILHTYQDRFTLDATAALAEVKKAYVVDMKGRIVQRLDSGGMKVTWNTHGIATGVYSIVLEFEDTTYAEKVVVN